MLITLFILATAEPPSVPTVLEVDNFWSFALSTLGIIATYLTTRYRQQQKKEEAVELEKEKARTAKEAEDKRQSEQLKAEREKAETAIQAEKEKLVATLEYEKARLIAEKENLLATLEAEKERLQSEYEIEMARLAGARDSSTQEEIIRIRGHFWKTMADRDLQILELKEDLKAERAYSEALRDYIYNGSHGEIPKRSCFDRKKLKPDEVMTVAGDALKEITEHTGAIELPSIDQEQ